MCLKPSRIYNPAARLGLGLGQRYEIEVPCGECAECKEAKKNEWYLRTYWQCRQTWDEKGYVLFDTLTYNNENLPHVSDFIKFEWNEYKFSYPDETKDKLGRALVDVIHHNLKKENELEYNILNSSCFNTDDYRYFFVRLRRNLDYYGYDSTKVKYFLTSEYGSTEGKTHRPHYHILFFVTDSRLSPITLSNMIDRSWKKGRTDGVGYYHDGWSDSKEYVLQKRTFGPGYNHDENYMRAVCNYVAKYVMKDSEFQKVINDRLDKLFKFMFAIDYENNSKVMEKYKKLLHEVSQFHRQSKGFGEYGINPVNYSEEDWNWIKESGMMYIPDSKCVKKHIVMPMYYQMKLFYYPYYENSGKKKMILTDEGIEWKISRCRKNIDRLEVRMNEWFKNIDINYKYNENFPYEKDEFKRVISDYLDGRTWRDYAIYTLIYKGRIKCEDDDLDSFIRKIFEPVVDDVLDEYPCCYNYATKLTRRKWKCNFITFRDIGQFKDVKGGKMWTGSPDYLFVGYNEDSEIYYGSIKDKVEKSGNIYLSPYWFSKMYCYNQDSKEEFRNFDDICMLFKSFNEGLNNAKQKAFDLKEEQTKRFKDLGLLGYNKNIG